MLSETGGITPVILHKWIKTWSVLVTFVFLAGQHLPLFAAAPVVYDFRLVQGQAKLPAVAVYAEIVGTGDVPAKGIKAEDLKVSLGPAPGKVGRVVPFEDSGEGIGYVLMVDISKSLSVAQFLEMKETIAAFVDAMSKEDQAALVTFGSAVNTVQAFTPNHSKIKEKLAALQLTDDETAFYDAIDKGIAAAKTKDEGVPRRRVLITLTDGVNDIKSGAGKDDILGRLATDPVPLYLIGFIQGRPTEAEESAIGVMKQLARISGGRYYDGRGGSWRGIYFAITRAIRSAFLVEADIPNFRSDGGVYPVEISLQSANREWKEKLQLTVPAGGTVAAADNSAKPGQEKKSGEQESSGNFPLVAGGIGLIAALLGAYFWRRRRETEPAVRPEGAQFASPGFAAVTEPGVLVRLTLIHEDSSANPIELEISDRVILGSDPKVSNLVFDRDSHIAPAHCVIIFTVGRLFIEDLDTEKGTFVNGVALTGRQCLEEQDVLKLGNTEMRLTFPA